MSELEKNQKSFTLQDVDTNEIILSAYVYPDKLEGLTQIHIETLHEVYDGPIDYLKFSEK